MRKAKWGRWVLMGGITAIGLVGLIMVLLGGMKSAKHRPIEVVEEYDWKGEKRTRKVSVLDLDGGEKIEFVFIPAGSFQMGSPESDSDEDMQGLGVLPECPRHEVVLTRDYYIAKHVVTKGQFARFADAANDQIRPEKEWNFLGFDYTDRQPVVNVTWNDAVDFCDWVDDRLQNGKAGEQLLGAWNVRLPTEAEWEYACRGGTSTRWFTGDEPESLEGYARFAKWNLTSPVGSCKPNPFGLYDMAGNVWQWRLDFSTYSSDRAVDPRGRVGASASDDRISFRGGCWRSDARRCRSASRHRDRLSCHGDEVGFRPVLVPSAQ